LSKFTKIQTQIKKKAKLNQTSSQKRKILVVFIL